MSDQVFVIVSFNDEYIVRQANSGWTLPVGNALPHETCFQCAKRICFTQCGLNTHRKDLTFEVKYVGKNRIWFTVSKSADSTKRVEIYKDTAKWAPLEQLPNILNADSLLMLLTLPQR